MHLHDKYWMYESFVTAPPLTSTFFSVSCVPLLPCLPLCLLPLVCQCQSVCVCVGGIVQLLALAHLSSISHHLQYRDPGCPTTPCQSLPPHIWYQLSQPLCLLNEQSYLWHCSVPFANSLFLCSSV